jgi:hypothetical protein
VSASKRFATDLVRAALFALLLTPACAEQSPTLPELDAEAGNTDAGNPDEVSANTDAGDEVPANTDAGGPEPDASIPSTPRALYTWNFGGVEQLSATDAVELLRSTGYAGIAVDTSRAETLQDYLDATASTPDFRVVSAYVALQLHRGEPFSDARHKAAIDALAQAKQGDLWLTFRDDKRTQTQQAITNLVRGIVAYAKAKAVRVVWYPHDNNVYATTEEAMPIVAEIDEPNFGVALNLIHELRAGKSDPDALEGAFETAGDKLFAVTLTGAAEDLTTITALHESHYELRPFIELIAASSFVGPVGFLNHTLTQPRTYLPLSLEYWQAHW